MFITRKSLSRRAILRGMGATVALPFLDAMVPALTATARTAANPVRRFGTVFVGLGERPSHWRPATDGVNFEMSPILKPLEKFRDHMTVVSELCTPINSRCLIVFRATIDSRDRLSASKQTKCLAGTRYRHARLIFQSPRRLTLVRKSPAVDLVLARTS